MSAWKDHLAIKRIYNVFKKNKERIYPEDIEALKHINHIVDYGVDKIATDNILFTKLLCAMLRYHLWHYSDIDLAKRKVASDLNLSMDAQVTLLAKTLNDIDRESFLSTIDENNITASQNLIIEKLEKNWKVDSVKNSLYRTANDLITQIENYK